MGHKAFEKLIHMSTVNVQHAYLHHPFPQKLLQLGGIL